MHMVKPAFFQCLKRLEAKKNRDYTWAEIGRSMGISRQAAQMIFTGDVNERSSTQYATLARMLDFFESEDMPVTLNDLFHVSRTADEGSDDG